MVVKMSQEILIDQKWKETEHEVKNLQATLSLKTRAQETAIAPVLRMRTAMKGLLTLGSGKKRSKADSAKLAEDLETALAQVDALQATFTEKESLWQRLLDKKNDQLLLSMKREQSSTVKLRTKIKELAVTMEVQQADNQQLEQFIQDKENEIKEYSNVLGYKLRALGTRPETQVSSETIQNAGNTQHISSLGDELLVQLQNDSKELAEQLQQSKGVEVVVDHKYQPPPPPPPEEKLKEKVPEKIIPSEVIKSLLESNGFQSLLEMIVTQCSGLDRQLSETALSSINSDPSLQTNQGSDSDNLRLVAAALEFRLAAQRNLVLKLRESQLEKSRAIEKQRSNRIAALARSVVQEQKSNDNNSTVRVKSEMTAEDSIVQNNDQENTQLDSSVLDSPVLPETDSSKEQQQPDIQPDKKTKLAPKLPKTKLLPENPHQTSSESETETFSEERNQLQSKVDCLLMELASLRPCEHCGKRAAAKKLRNSIVGSKSHNTQIIQTERKLSSLLPGGKPSFQATREFNFSRLSNLPILVDVRGHVVKDKERGVKHDFYENFTPCPPPERSGGGGAGPRRAPQGGAPSLPNVPCKFAITTFEMSV